MLVRQDRAMMAIAIVLDVAFHAGQGAAVSAGEIADRVGQARRGIEPLLQALTRAGLLDSLRGSRGGYRLGRPRRDLRLLDVVDAVAEGEAEPPPGRLGAAVLAPLWAEVEAACRERLAALTVDDLLQRAAAVGLHRPAAGPVNFAI